MSSNPGEEETEEDECFYESLDRILSSSSTTTCSSSSSSSPAAVSEDEYDDDYDDNSIPRFPKSSVLSNYDVWITEPSSIEERRKRLLQNMGLSHDFSLARRDVEFGRSISSDQLRIKTHQQQQQRGHIADDKDKSNSFIPRSKSDSAAAAAAAAAGDCNSCSTDHCNCSTTSSSSTTTTTTTTTTSIHSIPYSIQSTAESDPLVINHQINLLSKPRTSNGSIGSPTANVASLNKPPTGKLSRRVDEIKNNATDLSIDPSSNSLTNGVGEFDTNSNCTEVVMDPDQSCTIKDLDNGKEFVVNELREDGLWNKVREVGTDRQLTLEEFEMFVGHSPIVQELMRRQNVEDLDSKKDDPELNRNGSGNGGSKSKKKGGWFKSIKNVASTVTGHRERRSSDERDTSSEKGGRRSSSATDDSQDVSFHGPERVKVRQYGKSCKELTALYKSQEIQAHNGSIWSIKFSLDGQYLATAGEDCVIHVWQVIESEKKGDMLMEKLEDGIANLYFLANGSPEPSLVLSKVENHSDKKRRGRASITRKSISLDHIMLPESVFALSEKPICSFRGHLADVLDLSWSKSQYLLSSSMDKTVRLWHMDSDSCLKTFSHSDYVTCIQFNPVDDEYFISGSLDAKVRIWSIRDRQVVDWFDIHEMVTAACFTPDGQGALVGSYKGSCHLYNTSENKLHPKNQIDLQNKKKKSRHKKITGFQFAPGSSSEVIITSADSRIRVIDGDDLVHKFKGFRNTSSQISGSLTANGKYVVCASEDSYVYVWKHEGESRPSRSKGVTVTQSFEHFHCQDVSVAIPWPGLVDNGEQNSLRNTNNKVSFDNHTSPFVVEEANGHEGSPAIYGSTNSPLHGTIASVSNNYFFDKFSATWPEEKLLVASRKRSPSVGVEFSSAITEKRSAWGMVIVTAGLRGEIKTFQNFGLPVRI